MIEACREIEPCSVHPQIWFDIRPAAPNELPAVMESWLGTFKRSRAAGVIPNHLYNEVMLCAVTQLLQRGACVDVLVARSHPDTVLAWIAHERDKRSNQAIVHYLFTKDGFRQRGYSKLLLAYVGVDEGDKFIYTHSTPFAQYYDGGHWNPGIARRKEL